MYIQFCAIPPHEGRNAMYSLITKVDYATNYTLGGIVRLKSYEYNAKKVQKVFDFHSCILWDISFIARFYDSLFLKRLCGYSGFDLLKFPEASRLGWK
jgi:hypothetical protein